MTRPPVIGALPLHFYSKESLVEKLAGPFLTFYGERSTSGQENRPLSFLYRMVKGLVFQSVGAAKEN